MSDIVVKNKKSIEELYYVPMTFLEFIAYWKAESKSPPSEATVTMFRVWCQKLTERLDELKASPNENDRKTWEQEKDKYLHEKNHLIEWMKRLWEFYFGNTSLRAQGRPNFLG